MVNTIKDLAIFIKDDFYYILINIYAFSMKLTVNEIADSYGFRVR